MFYQIVTCGMLPYSLFFTLTKQTALSASSMDLALAGVLGLIAGIHWAGRIGTICTALTAQVTFSGMVPTNCLKGSVAALEFIMPTIFPEVSNSGPPELPGCVGTDTCTHEVSSRRPLRLVIVPSLYFIALPRIAAAG